MNKKQELVNQVLAKLEKSHVALGAETSLRAPNDFWKQHPNGHYTDMFDYSIECLLSRLTEENLAQLTAADIPADVSFSALWRQWGLKGYLRSTPQLLEFGGVPTLRIRHDSYLSWFRGYCFQNSYDAYGAGSNGESDKDLAAAVDICQYIMRITPKWAQRCHALLLSYPFYACRGKQTFYKALQEHPEAFDQLLLRTDEKLMHVGLPADATLNGLMDYMRTETMRSLIAYEFPIVCNEQQIALLCLGTWSIQLIWVQEHVRNTFTLNFPYWEEEMPLDADTYRILMWAGLSYTMLTLAGFSATEHKIVPLEPTKVFATPPLFYPEATYIDSTETLRHKLRELKW